MKTKIFKSVSSMRRRAAMLLVLLTLFAAHAWGDSWYSHNNGSRIYFNDYNSKWVSDPSSDGITFLMGRDLNYTNAGPGSQAYRMTHIEHTKLWYCDVAKWGNDMTENSMYQYVAFRFASGTTGWNDWQGGWDNRVSARATYGSNTKYSVTVNDNITGRTKYYSPSSSSSNTGYTVNSEAGINSFKYTAYLRVNFDEEADGTYDGVISGDSQWSHGVTFDFTGTYLVSDNTASEQSTISNLDRNYWTDGSKKYGYEGIPNTGEVIFKLKTIDTGFEIAGWAYSESATSPAYTDNKNNPTFQVLSETSYVAFIRRKSYTITLNDNGGSGGSGSKTVKYDRSSNMTTSVSVPSKLGYSFQGYYTGQDGTGSMVINASGVWQKNVTNYTGTDGSGNPKWIRDDGATLYAKWTQTVTLHDNHGGSNNGSISAIYNGVMSGKSVPTYTDHTLDLGYYAETGCSNIVMNLDGTLVANVAVSGTKWTSSTNKWIHDGDGRLYAHWKVNAPGSITCTDNVVTIAVPTDATVHYTIDGNTPTGSSPTYDPSDKPVITSSGITVKAIAVQSGCTNSEVTSQAVTYTPVYTVGFTTTNTSKTSGETSVLQNKTYAATFTANTGYDLPTSVTVTIGGVEKTVTTDYTWSVSDGTGTLTILENKITGNVAITVSGVAKTYTSTDNIEGGDGSDGTYTATYDATSIAINTAPALSGYDVEGYYTESTLNNKIATPNNNGTATLTKDFVRAETRYTDTDGKWVYQGAPTLYAKWSPKSYTLNLYQNDGTEDYTSITVTMGSSTCVPDITAPTRTGYSFGGYYTEESGGTKVINTDASKPVTTYFDGSARWQYDGNVDLYAHWTPVALTFNNNSGSGDGNWNTASNWSPTCVPTSGHDVTISAEVTVSGTAAAKSVTIGSGGKVTIAATGVLEVAGTVTNTDADKLIINTTTSSQGALICDLTSAPTATVNMSIPSGGFHLIASPTGGARVSSTFSGSGIYTYAWEEGKGWDRRGYYDDFMGNEAILIYGQTSCSFSGILSNACGGSARYSTGEGVVASAQGVNMIANPLTASIKIAAMTISGSKDGAVHLYNGSWVGKTPATAGDAVIPAMQGYGVIATSGGGSVSFTYDTAVRGASSKNAPLNAPKRTDSDILDHITLSVTTNDRKVDLNLYENEQFTERIDVGWEAIYMEGDGRFGELYAIADEKMNILATPNLEGTVLGFVPGQAASYTLSFEGNGRGYYLNDIEMQESTLIEEGNTYTFSSGNNNSARFIVSRTPIQKVTTGADVIYDGTKARKQMIDGILYIIRDGRMYDATGALVK